MVNAPIHNPVMVSSIFRYWAKPTPAVTATVQTGQIAKAAFEYDKPKKVNSEINVMCFLFIRIYYMNTFALPRLKPEKK